MVWGGSHIFGPRAPEHFIWIIFIDLILLLYSVILAAIAFEYQEQNKLKISLLLAAILLVTTGAVSLKEQIWWPFVAAAVLVASRLRLLFHFPHDEEQKRQIIGYPLACLMLLFVLMWPTAFLPIPAWGVKPIGKSPAIWTKFPQRALALGAIYYGLLGLYAAAVCLGFIPKARDQKDIGIHTGNEKGTPPTR
jgi:hypothetical protein